jgi:cysteinyl-tRNA synthetase
MISTAIAAFQHYIQKNLPLLPSNTSAETYPKEVERAYGRVIQGLPLDETAEKASDKEAKIKLHMKAAESAATAIQKPATSTEFLDKTEDVLLLYLDSRFGSDVDSQDHAIFTKLARKYEDRFNEDMRALNVGDPNVTTRVTEYVPQIVAFVQKILDHNCAYVTSDGSVYFDINAFEKQGHPYARLSPQDRSNTALQDEGEGALTSGRFKKSSSDFAYG